MRSWEGRGGGMGVHFMYDSINNRINNISINDTILIKVYNKTKNSTYGRRVRERAGSRRRRKKLLKRSLSTIKNALDLNMH